MTASSEVIVKKDLAELSKYASGLFMSIANDSISRNGRFSVVLSGGSTPRSLYKLLSENPFASSIDWTRTYFFFGDERCMPPDSPESNYGMVMESLFQHIPVPYENIFRWQTEYSPEHAAELYENELKSFFKGELPIFDLVLLGMGADGHTASLFPHTNALHDVGRLAAENWVEQLNAYRLTFTFELINQASNILFLIAGSEKASAVTSVLNNSASVEELPARGIRPVHGGLTWLLDEAAAASLPG